jgi:hypothetical protein
LGFGNNDLAAARLHIRLGLHGRSPSVNFVMPSIPAPFALSYLPPFVQRPKWMTYPAFLFVLAFMAILLSSSCAAFLVVLLGIRFERELPIPILRPQRLANLDARLHVRFGFHGASSRF